MSLAVGLDVSELRMGWAIVDYDTQEPLALGVENLRDPDGGWPEDQVLRAIDHIKAHVVGRLPVEHGEVYVVGIEDAYIGPSKMGSLRQAGVIGMATMAARVVFGPTVTYWPIPNSSWLEPLDIKPASRKSADIKAATRTWMLRRLPVALIPSEEVISQDAADALGIATACALLTVKKEPATYAAGVELVEREKGAA